MIEIEDEDIVINNYVPLTEESEELTTIHINFNGNKKEAEQLKQQILQDIKLRKKIVDLADIWDGVESARYGKQLEVILNDLGIKDIPEFYSKENMDKFIKELAQDREDRQIVKEIKECLKNVHFTDDGEVLISKLQKILEEKK